LESETDLRIKPGTTSFNRLFHEHVAILNQPDTLDRVIAVLNEERAHSCLTNLRFLNKENRKAGKRWVIEAPPWDPAISCLPYSPPRTSQQRETRVENTGVRKRAMVFRCDECGVRIQRAGALRSPAYRRCSSKGRRVRTRVARWPLDTGAWKCAMPRWWPGRFERRGRGASAVLNLRKAGDPKNVR
jgi:hypothetical protein